MAVMDYVNELKRQRDLLTEILSSKGVEVSTDEKFNTLIPKVSDIPTGGGSENVIGIIEKFTASYIDNANITANLPLPVKGTTDRFCLGEMENATFEEA